MAAVFRRCLSCLNLGKPLVLRKSGNLPSFSGSNKGKIFFSASWIKNILFRHRVSNDRTHFQGFSNPFEFQSLYTKLLNWSALPIDFAINIFWAKERFVSKSMNPPDFYLTSCAYLSFIIICYKRFLFREVLIVLILHLSIHIGNVFRSHISTEPQRVHLDHFSNQGGNFSKTKSIILMKVLKMRHSYRFADGERIYFSSDDTRPKAYLFKRKFRYSVLTLKNVHVI